MIVVTGHIRIDPDQVARLRPAMRTLIEATRAEDGCLLYAYGEDVLEPGVIRIVERWRDWDSLTVHGAAPHIGVWRAVLADAGGVFDREVTAHETGTERAL